MTLTIDGTDRVYLLQRSANPLAPVLVFLHGTGGTAAWAADEAMWPTAARAAGFHLVVPEGLAPDPRKPPKFLTNPPRWNDGSTHPGDPIHSDADDVAFLSAVVADVLATVSADPTRVYVTGFSNGAGMTFRFAAERAEAVAAIAPVAGHCWIPHPRPARRVPTLYIIGNADPLIPLRGGAVKIPWGGRLLTRPPVVRTLERWANAIGCEPASQLVRNDPDIREEVYPPGPEGTEFRALFVDGLGHHWPGGKGQLNARIGGPKASTLNANEAIAAFFRR